jgi:hypothetical protein
MEGGGSKVPHAVRLHQSCGRKVQVLVVDCDDKFIHLCREGNSCRQVVNNYYQTFPGKGWTSSERKAGRGGGSGLGRPHRRRRSHVSVFVGRKTAVVKSSRITTKTIRKKRVQAPRERRGSNVPGVSVPVSNDLTTGRKGRERPGGTRGRE